MSTTSERLAAQKRTKIEKAGFDELDDRIGSSSFLQKALDHIFPDHWSFMVGEIAMYCFVILLVTGIYLALYYTPSSADVVYTCTKGQHCYLPLVGQHMSEAYLSVLKLSFDVRGGLVMRQVHHWAAIVFMAAIAFHLCRVFFTGAFRKPRELNWTIGLTLMLLVMAEGFSGYSLPDDLLSGTGLRVVYSIIESIPLIGTWLAFDLWGGAFPGTTLISRLFVLHEFILPLVLLGALTAHLAIIWRQGHTDFPGPGKTETNIRGSRVWPQYALKSAALLLIVFAVLCALGGFFQVNPIWIYGPYSPFNVSAGAQPDWYVGWLDGSVRLWPHWEFRSFGHEIANPFFPGVLIPGIIFGAMFAWPQIDRKLTKDTGFHNLLQRPRDVPIRTAIGCAALTFFADLTFASATDLLGNDFHVPFERLIEILQYGAFIGPIAAGLIAYRVCLSLQRSGSHPIMRPVGGIIVRHADGSYHTPGHHDGDDNLIHEGRYAGHVDEHGVNGIGVAPHLATHNGNGHSNGNGRHADGNGNGNGNGNGHSNGNGHGGDAAELLEDGEVVAEIPPTPAGDPD
jgi:ubiquinol-cytochrome c reductase cytochrome b subunit